MVSFFKALTYPFDQKGWAKELLLAIGVACIPIVGYFLLKGWQYEISVRVRREADDLLPGWGRFAGRFQRGLLVSIAMMLYYIPFLILAGITLWMWIGPIVRTLAGVIPWDTPIAEVYGPTLGLRLGMIIITALIWFVTSSIYWSGYLRYIETQRFVLFFDLSTNMYIMITTIADDFVMGLFTILAQMIAGLLEAAVAALLTATGVGVFLIPVLVPAINTTFMSYFGAYMLGHMAKNTFGEQPEPIYVPRPRPPLPPRRRYRDG